MSYVVEGWVIHFNDDLHDKRQQSEIDYARQTFRRLSCGRWRNDPWKMSAQPMSQMVFCRLGGSYGALLAHMVRDDNLSWHAQRRLLSTSTNLGPWCCDLDCNHSDIFGCFENDLSRWLSPSWKLLMLRKPSPLHHIVWVKRCKSCYLTCESRETWVLVIVEWNEDR